MIVLYSIGVTIYEIALSSFVPTGVFNATFPSQRSNWLIARHTSQVGAHSTSKSIRKTYYRLDVGMIRKLWMESCGESTGGNDGARWAQLCFRE